MNKQIGTAECLTEQVTKQVWQAGRAVMAPEAFKQVIAVQNRVMAVTSMERMAFEEELEALTPQACYDSLTDEDAQALSNWLDEINHHED